MVGYILKHLTSYLLFFLVFVGGLAAFFWLPERTQKVMVVMGLASLYLLWGAWHHYEEKNLTVNVFLEYLVIAGFILWLLTSLL